MTTEWLALWCPFLIFGSLTMVFCMVAWKEIGTLLVPMTQDAARVPTGERRTLFGFVIAPMKKGVSKLSTGAREASKQRRRLLRIAMMISVCLLLNTIATLSVSSKMEGWSRTADISLACSIKETWNARDWEAYGFNTKDVVNVCSAEETTRGSCESDCQWDHSRNPTFLSCGGSFCDCPCSSFIEIERPSVGILTLAYVSQSMVVAIVGLNLGFRKKNLEIWVAFFRTRVLTLAPGGTSILAAGPNNEKPAFEFDSKAYDNE
jgi:hypothetical protein